MIKNGDNEFLFCARENLSDEMYSMAENLIYLIRDYYDGNLEAGKRKKFTERPDNFWSVTVQNRIDELNITVRGSCEYFSNFKEIEIKKDRRDSYSRFKITKETNINDALNIIKYAKRKL
ncbi:hypothetical protein [Gluconobacter oxydans]|uniref:hypothetical protein n=1 Tax=Gluconobacter oxydans TaxID=442 RepID=UPI000A4A0B05|nr:hypothetical protein [Gluconobacter oxydans]